MIDKPLHATAVAAGPSTIRPVRSSLRPFVCRLWDEHLKCRWNELCCWRAPLPWQIPDTDDRTASAAAETTALIACLKYGRRNMISSCCELPICRTVDCCYCWTFLSHRSAERGFIADAAFSTNRFRKLSSWCIFITGWAKCWCNPTTVTKYGKLTGIWHLSPFREYASGSRTVVRPKPWCKAGQRPSASFNSRLKPEALSSPRRPR